MTYKCKNSYPIKCRVYIGIPLANIGDYTICDVICEKVAYCGTNSVTLDQPFSHVSDSIYGMHCTGRNKKVTVDAHEQQIL